MLTSPLKPGGPSGPKGRVASTDSTEFLSPISGLAQSLASRVPPRERLQINRNVSGAILMLLSCLKPEHVKGKDKCEWRGGCPLVFVSLSGREREELLVSFWPLMVTACTTSSVWLGADTCVTAVLCACPPSAAMFHWVLRCRAALGAGLVSSDNAVRRTSAQALGELARIGGTTFAKNLVASIQKQLQEAPEAGSGTPKPGSVKLNLAAQAGAVFALGCVQRANVVTRGRICVENVHDIVIFDAARETKQPLRTWALHTWWMLLEAAGSAFNRYVQPTLSLLDAHILSVTHIGTYSPSLATGADVSNSGLFGRLYRAGGVVPSQGPSGPFSRSRDADDGFGVLACDPYPAGRLAALDSSVYLCLARILLSLIEGLGPELERKKDVSGGAGVCPAFSCVSPAFSCVCRIVRAPTVACSCSYSFMT